MAINRFETVRPQEYQSVYVPLPFEEMMKAGALHQGRIDDNQQQADAITALLANVKSLDRVKLATGDERYVADRDEVIKYKQGINKQIEDLAIGYLDKGDVNYRQKLNGLSRQVINDLSPEGKLGKIHSQATMYEQQEKAMQDAKDLDTTRWRAQNVWDSRSKYAEANGAGYTGTAQLSLGNIGEYVDRNKEIDDLTKGVQSELVKGGLYAYSDGKYIRTGKMTAATADKVLRTVDGFLANSKALKDIYAEAQFRKSNGDQHADEYAQQQINSLRSAMLKYVESDGTKDMKADPIYLAHLRHALDNETQAVTAQTVNTEVTDNAMNLPPVAQDIKFNPDGSIATPAKSKMTMPTITDPMSGGVSHFEKVDYQAKQVEQEAFIADIKKNNPSVANLTPKAAYDAYMQAKAANARTPVLGRDVELAAGAFNDRVFKSGLNSKGISIASSVDAISEPTNLQTVAESLGLDEKELRAQAKDGKVMGIGNGSRPGQFILSVPNGNGQPVNLLVNGSPEQEEFYERSYQASLLEKQGKSGTNIFKDPKDNNSPYISYTQLAPGETGYEFKTITYGAHEVPATAENIAAVEAKAKANPNVKYEKKGDVLYIADPGRVFDNKTLLDQDHARYETSSYYPKKAAVKKQQEYSDDEE